MQWFNTNFGWRSRKFNSVNIACPLEYKGKNGTNFMKILFVPVRLLWGQQAFFGSVDACSYNYKIAWFVKS